jgi:hypothetical protein
VPRRSQSCAELLCRSAFRHRTGANPPQSAPAAGALRYLRTETLFLQIPHQPRRIDLLGEHPDLHDPATRGGFFPGSGPLWGRSLRSGRRTRRRRWLLRGRAWLMGGYCRGRSRRIRRRRCCRRRRLCRLWRILRGGFARRGRHGSLLGCRGIPRWMLDNGGRLRGSAGLWRRVGGCTGRRRRTVGLVGQVYGVRA